MRASMRLIGACAAAFVVAVAAAACGSDDDSDSGSGGSEAEMRVMVPADHFGTTYPFILADELGYFEAEGIDVSFEVADGSTGAVQQVIGGNAEVAAASASAWLSAAAADQPVRALFTTQYRNVFDLIAPSDSGITSLEDLSGGRIAVSDLAGGEVPLVRGLLREAGIGGGDYEIVPAGEGANLTVDALESGEVDAYSSNVWDAGAIRAAGLDVETILPEEAQNFPGNSIVVTESYLAENQEELVGFMRAVAKAMTFANANPDAGYEILASVNPEQFEDRKLASEQWKTAVEFLGTPPEEAGDEPIGTPFEPGLQGLHDFLLEGEEEEGALPGPVDLGAVLDTELIAEANDFDPAEIEDEAREYKPTGN